MTPKSRTTPGKLLALWLLLSGSAAAAPAGSTSGSAAPNAVSQELSDRLDDAVRRIKQARAARRAGLAAASPAQLQQARQGLQTLDPRARRGAIQNLQALRTPEAIVALERVALRDSDRSARQDALIALGKTRHPAAVKPLREVLQKDPEMGFRRVAALSLARVGGPEAVDALKSYPTPSDAALQLALCRALAILDQHPDFKSAVQRLQDPDPKLRAEAALALSYSRDAAYVDALKNMSEQDAHGRVRFKALESLKRLEYSLKTYPQSLEFLKTSLKDGSGTVRLWAATELLELDNDEGLQLLKDAALQGCREAGEVLDWALAGKV